MIRNEKEREKIKNKIKTSRDYKRLYETGREKMRE